MKSVLLEFLSTDEKTLIFVVRQNWESKGIQDLEPLVFESDFNESDAVDCVGEIQGLYDEWRHEEYSPSYLDRIKLERRTSFYDIGDKIFSDELISSIDGYDLIYFVPFSALHRLPLHAMRYKGRDIIDMFACSYLPSASVLQFVNKDKSRPRDFKLKGVGVDFKNKEGAFVEEIDDLTDEEYLHTFPLVEEEATKENFFKDNEQYNILHCSTHGYASAESPLKSSIILHMHKDLRKSLSSFAGESEYLYELENNIDVKNCSITVEDLVKNLKTPFELIFMNACVTGANKNEAGDELIGLSRGLFYSGTKAMILTLFNTSKGSSLKDSAHVKNFYEDWVKNKDPKAIAFQKYIKRMKHKESYEHPFYWFSYVFIGNPY